MILKHPLRSIFLLIFFAIQIYLPLSYYLGNYPWDERFSWRMFSSVRSLQCQSQFIVEQTQTQAQNLQPCPNHPSQTCQKLKPSEHLHVVWINLIQRGRLEVINEFAQQHCAKSPNAMFFAELKCEATDGSMNNGTRELIDVIDLNQNLCEIPLNLEALK
jgi:hypothetical protein